jgi:flagellar hook-length control protein FliK
MSIASIDQSRSSSAAPVELIREQEGGEKFESSLMSALASSEDSEQGQREASDDSSDGEFKDHSAEAADSEPGRDEEGLTGEEVSKGEDGEEIEAKSESEQLLEASVVAVEQVVSQSPTVENAQGSEARQSTGRDTANEIQPVAAVEGVEPDGLPRTNPQQAGATAPEERAQDERRQVVQDDRVRTTTEPQAQARTVATEVRPDAARATGPVPTSVSNAADPREALAGTADQGRGEQAKDDDSRREQDKSDARLAGIEATRGEAHRGIASAEVPIESQVVRDVSVAEAQLDVNVARIAGTPQVAPVEVAVQIAEPTASEGTGRPMPPEAIPQHIEWLIAKGGGTAQINLYPPDLGKLSIQVTVRGGEVQVVMNVQESASLTVVAEYRESLENSLASKDLKLDQFEVREWNNRDGTGADEKGAAQEKQNDTNDGNGRARDEQGGLKGVASALAHVERGEAISAGDDGVNLRV